MRAAAIVRMYWRRRDHRIGKLHDFAVSVWHRQIAVRFLFHHFAVRAQERLVLVIKHHPPKAFPLSSEAARVDGGGLCGLPSSIDREKFQ